MSYTCETNLFLNITDSAGTLHKYKETNLHDHTKICPKKHTQTESNGLCGAVSRELWKIWKKVMWKINLVFDRLKAKILTG